MEKKQEEILKMGNVIRVSEEDDPDPKLMDGEDSHRTLSTLELEDIAATEFMCGICQDILFKAVNLACGHMFCTECIRKWQNRMHSCPICRKAMGSCSQRPNIAVDSFLLRVAQIVGGTFKDHLEERIAKFKLASEQESNLRKKNGMYQFIKYVINNCVLFGSASTTSGHQPSRLMYSSGLGRNLSITSPQMQPSHSTLGEVESTTVMDLASDSWDSTSSGTQVTVGETHTEQEETDIQDYTDMDEELEAMEEGTSEESMDEEGTDEEGTDEEGTDEEGTYEEEMGEEGASEESSDEEGTAEESSDEDGMGEDVMSEDGMDESTDEESLGVSDESWTTDEEDMNDEYFMEIWRQLLAEASDSEDIFPFFHTSYSLVRNSGRTTF